MTGRRRRRRDVRSAAAVRCGPCPSSPQGGRRRRRRRRPRPGRGRTSRARRSAWPSTLVSSPAACASSAGPSTPTPQPRRSDVRDVDGSKIGQRRPTTPGPTSPRRTRGRTEPRLLHVRPDPARAPTRSACGRRNIGAGATRSRAARTASSTTARSGSSSTSAPAPARCTCPAGPSTATADRAGHGRRHGRRHTARRWSRTSRGRTSRQRTRRPAGRTASTPISPISQGTHTVCVVAARTSASARTTRSLPDLHPRRQPARGHRHARPARRGKLRRARLDVRPRRADDAADRRRSRIDGARATRCWPTSTPDVAAATPAPARPTASTASSTSPRAAIRCASLALNIGFGSNRTLGLPDGRRSTSPPPPRSPRSPPPPPASTIAGWASDPDTTSPISVRVTVDGTHVGTVVANQHGAATTAATCSARALPMHVGHAHGLRRRAQRALRHAQLAAGLPDGRPRAAAARQVRGDRPRGRFDRSRA